MKRPERTSERPSLRHRGRKETEQVLHESRVARLLLKPIRGERGREESFAFLNVQGRPGAVCQNRSEDLSILEVTDVAKNLGTKPPVAPGPCGSTWTWEERELQTVGGGRAGDRPTKTAARRRTTTVSGDVLPFRDASSSNSRSSSSSSGRKIKPPSHRPTPRRRAFWKLFTLLSLLTSNFDRERHGSRSL